MIRRINRFDAKLPAAVEEVSVSREQQQLLLVRDGQKFDRRKRIEERRVMVLSEDAGKMGEERIELHWMRSKVGFRFLRNKIRADLSVVDSVVSIKGVEYTVGDDELILPDLPKGDAKIDAEGHLLGGKSNLIIGQGKSNAVNIGREYKPVTFTSPSRRNPNRIYALTIDAARACGYSDSLAFLRRCPQAMKLACNAEERQMLIDIGRVTGNLKHRMVTMVAMRNIYKLMGARVVKSESSCPFQNMD